MNMLFPAIQADEKNVTYAFRLTISLPPDSRIRLAASNACMLFQDGDLLFRGPMRTAHGHSLLSEIPLASRKDSTLVVEVAYYGINGFYCVERMCPIRRILPWRFVETPCIPATYLFRF